MREDNCIFCKIANGDIPTMSLYEDDEFNVIFDAGPATLGHALILPKNHAKNIFWMEDDELARAHVLAKKVASALIDVFRADGVNIVQNNNPAAGQSVFHFHIHVIPRYENDGAMVSWTPGEQDKEALEAALDKLRTKIAED